MTPRTGPNEQARTGGRATWLGEFERHVKTGRHVLLHGNVRDLVLFDGNFLLLPDVLDQILQQLCYTVRIRYNLIDGISLADPNMAQLLPSPLSARLPTEDRTNTRPAGQSRVDNVDAALVLVRDILAECREAQVSVVFDFIDKMFSGGEQQDPEDRARMVLTSRMFTEAFPSASDTRSSGLRNSVICVGAHLGQIPAWLYRDQPQLQTIQVPRPDEHERGKYITTYFDRFYRASETSAAAVSEHFKTLTEGMSSWDLEVLRRTSHVLQIPIGDCWKLVDRFRHGTLRDPWEDRGHLTSLDNAAQQLEKDVIGQSKAVRAVDNVLTLARGGIHVDPVASRARRPKGVLFFVGPTGVGKTELAKALTKLLFGDAAAFARFDMSEYAESHAALRLTGAPPSYVGYEAGGQLTNHMKARPFTVVLFDEIEKAHQSVLDKFLQVLDDGRLTDGLGETVSFAQSVIIFTSNIGSTVESDDGPSAQRKIAIDLSWDYAAMETHYRKAVEAYFADRQRPELLARIGRENVIVFDRLRPQERPEQIYGILDKFLNNAKVSAVEKHNVTLEFDPSVYKQVLKIYDEPAAIMLGARHIKNFVENEILVAVNRSVLNRPHGCGGLRVVAGPTGSTDVEYL